MLDSLHIDRIAFTIPIGDGIPIFWYGIIITLGIILGTAWAAREIEKRGQSVDELYNGIIVVVFAGYIFARFTYVILDVLDGNGARYHNLIDVINIRAGGVNILGGFVGAALIGLWFVRWRRLKFWHYADLVGPTLFLAQGLGRWGNFINQELYGPPTDRPWGILIEPAYRLPQYADLVQYPADTTRFHPTFLYESIALLMGFFLLVGLNRRFRGKWKPGTLFGLFLIWWGSNRAWIELFRPDQPTIGNSVVTYSMVAAVLIALAGVVVILYLYDKLPERQTKSQRRRVYKPKPRR